MCFKGWEWNIVPNVLACLHILQIKWIIKYKWCRAASAKFNWFEGFIIVLKVRHRTQLAWNFCDSWPNINIVLWCKMVFNELLHMAEHAQTIASIYKRKWGQINKSSLWIEVCVCSCVSGIWSTSLCPPTPVQTTTLRKVPTTLTLRWLLRELQLSSPKPRSSPSSSILLTELTPGTRSDVGTLNFFFPCKCTATVPAFSFPILHFPANSTKEPTMTQWHWSTLSTTSSPQATTRQWNCASYRIAAWCQAGTPSTWSAGSTITTPARYRARGKYGLLPSTRVCFNGLLPVPVDMFTVCFSCPAVSLGRTDAEDRTCFCHGQSPEVLELNQRHQLPQDPSVSIILEGLGLFVTINVGFYLEMTQISADHGPFSLWTGLILRKASGVSCWREERPSVWERVKDADTLTWTLRYVPFSLSVCLLLCVFFFFTLVVCFSLRRSSGSTTGITTLSCPKCSTGWASLCPVGSAKNWSTAGSGTAAGAHSSAHRTTAQLFSFAGRLWPHVAQTVEDPK